MAFRGSFQGQFNYHEQIPHGWDFQYADSSQGQFNYHAQFCQPYRPIIPNPSVAPFRHPQPRAYCEICDVELPNHQCWEIHNKGRKHRSKLRQKASNGQESSQIPNSQMNLVVPPKTVLESKKSKCHVENVSSQATVFKYKNFQQKDNTSGNGHGFKRKFVGDTVGKYMKMNNGIKRPMEPSKPDVSALSNSAEYLVQKPTLTPPPGPASPITTPICVGGSSLKLQFQHVSASQTQVSEGKEHHGIQIPTADSDVSTMTEDMCSDSAALAIAASPKGHMASQVHAPPPAPGSSFEPENQHGLQKEVLKGKEQHEIQNHTVKITDQPLSISVEVHDPAVSNINTQTENLNSDSSAIAIAGPMASQVPIPPQAMGSSFEPQIESHNYESRNSTGETNIQLLPLGLMEFDAPSGVRTNTKTADESSKAKAKAGVLTTELGITQWSLVFFIF